MNNDKIAFVLICLLVWNAFQSIVYGKKLDEILSLVKGSKPKPPEALGFSFYIEGEKVDSMFVKVTEKVKVSLKIKDAAGFDAKVDGLPAWSLSETALATLEIAADGMSALVSPLAPGACLVQVSADADLGEGVKAIVGNLPLEILSGEAVSIELAGEVVQEAAPAPAPVVEQPQA